MIFPIIFLCVLIVGLIWINTRKNKKDTRVSFVEAIVGLLLGAAFLIGSFLYAYTVFYGGCFESMFPHIDRGADLSIMNVPSILVLYSLAFVFMRWGFEGLIMRENFKLYWKIRRWLYVGGLYFLI